MPDATTTQLTPLQQAVIALQAQRARIAELEQAGAAPIAVIGIGCRYPAQGVSPAALWQALREGRDGSREVPRDRWDIDEFYDPVPGRPGKMYVRKACFIDGVDRFEPLFFRISPREAVGIDPQQRLLLEVTWEALEDAAIAAPALVGSDTGVFIGISTNDYSALLSRTAHGCVGNAGAGPGNAASVAAGRLSYTFGLQGPCVAVDTACSSSLVATHLAVQSLRGRECRLAVVAGVNLMLSPEITINFCQGRMLSPDGHCKTFDEAADGYVRGEGCGALVLKRLAEAEADGDRILAVLRGSAINQDGRSAGLTAPNGVAQEAVIRKALGNAGLSPDQIDYIEAHGTGTSLGDPIEMHALKAVFAGRSRPLHVGTVKTNIGHTEAASGVAGLIKAVLILQHQALPPSLHFRRLNPHIDAAGIDFRVPTALTDMPIGAIGVSSFGVSGTNAHIVLGAAPLPPPIAAAPASARPVLLISARSREALVELVARYREFLATTSDSFADICHTAAVGRARLPWWVAVADPAELATAEPANTPPPPLPPTSGRKVALPTAVFQRERCWIDAPIAGLPETAVDNGLHPLLGRKLPLPLSAETRWEAAITPRHPALAFLDEHRVDDRAILPAAGFVEMALSASPGAALAGLAITRPLPVSEEGERLVQTILAEDGGVSIVSYRGGAGAPEPITHASGRVVARGSAGAAPPEQAGAPLDSGLIYEAMARTGVSHGPRFQLLDDISRGEGWAGARLRGCDDEARFAIHPARLDAAFQLVAAALPDGGEETLLPAAIDRVALYHRPAADARVHAAAARSPSGVLADIVITDAAGVALEIAGLQFRRAAPAAAGTGFYRLEWRDERLIDGLAPPVFLPPPDEIAAAIASASSELAERHGVAAYASTASILEAAATLYVARALETLGLEFRPGAEFTFGAIAESLGIDERHHRLLRRLFGMLAEDGILVGAGRRWCIAAEPPAGDPAAIIKALIEEAPEMAGEVGVLRRCGKALAEVLTGRVEALGILFPAEGSGAGAFYETSPYARTINGLLEAAAARIAAALPRGRVLRVLEVGAGTGGATGAMLAALPPAGRHYVFSDVSQGFLTAAATKFAGREIETRLLDLERAPSEQGFAAGSFDVVLAANVLHATQDLAHSLGHIHELLAPGGVLLLVESGERRRWVDIVFGLTDGWWRFTDTERRPDHPLIDAQQWHELLGECGFAIAGEPAGELIVARRPGPAPLAGGSWHVAGHDRLPTAIAAAGLRIAAPAEAENWLVVPPPAAPDEQAQVELLLRLTEITRAALEDGQAPRLAFVAEAGLGHAGIAGFVRSLAIEKPLLRPRLLTAPPSDAALIDELLAGEALVEIGWDEAGRRQQRVLVPAAPEAGSPDLAGAWLVTGARGGVAQAIAAWLAEHGAGEIVLLSRQRPEAPAGIAVPVHAYSGDVADAGLIARLLREHQIRGIVHAAGVLAPAPVDEQTAETIRAVAHAKIGGALTLDVATRALPVRHFVLCASVAGVLGSARQVNHAFASSFIDGLAARRRSEGLPALSLDWGVWSGIGSAAALGFDTRADQLGLGSLTAAQGTQLFGRSLGGSEAQLVVLPSADWRRVTEHFEQGVPALFGELTGDSASGPAPAPSAVPIAAAADHDRAAELTRIVRQCLGLTGPIDPDTPLHDLGLDSLLAVEIRNRVERELGLAISVRELIEGASLRSLTEMRREPTVETPARRLIVPDPERRHEPFPLTDMQQAYWLGRRDDLALGSVGCYLYTEFDTSRVDLARAEAAWNQLVRRHDMLRVVIRPDGTQQILQNVPEYRFERLDLRGRDAEDELEPVRRRLAQRVAEPGNWPLFDIRATLLDDRVRLHIGFDLIALDAASIHALRREWARLYDDPTAALPPLKLSFRDVVVEEMAHRETAAWRRSEQYWKERAPDLPGAPELPVTGDPMRHDSRQFRRRRIVLSAEQANALRRQAQARGMTMPALLAAAYADILAAWSRTSRFSITVTLFNRNDVHPDIGLVLGDFTSTILLEVDARPDSFAQRAAALSHRLAADLEHAEFGGVRALREIARQRSGVAATVPFVFTSTLGFRRGETAEDAGGAAGWDQLGQTVYSVSSTPQVLIDHQISEEDGQLFCNWDAADGMFPPGMLDDMVAAHRGLLAELAEESGWARPVEAALPPQPRARLVPVPAGELLHAAFERRARETPRRTALIACDLELDYETLDAAAGELAQRLLSRLGTNTRDRLVAIGFPKGWRQIVAVLAVLKTGAAYLPIDPNLPATRRRLLIERSDAIVFDDEAEVDAALARARIGAQAPALPTIDNPSRLAYVIYTSGSTGLPKGVMIEHRGALATVGEVNRRWRLGAEDRVLGLSSLSFDLSVYDIFGPLSVGGALVLPPPGSERDPSQWAGLLLRHRVTVWNSVPALMAMQAEYGLPIGHRLRLVLLSGDWVPVELVSRLRRQMPEATLVALGGATEAAIWSNAHEIAALDPEWPSIPYGTPLAGHMLNIVNERDEPCPDWVVGEIEISGQGLARGYLNDPAQTAERFPTDPATGERRYRTGDLGRFRRYATAAADAPTPIEFLGREDLQVKVQGYRIELGEIEAALLSHPAVAEAVAVAPRYADNGQRTLHAFVVRQDAATGGDIAAALAAHLRERLPIYMVPASIDVVERMPLSANGKIDRGALAAAVRSTAATAGAAPGRLEKEVAAAIAELMQVERIDPRRSLFELGATSLTLVALQRLLSDRFGRTVPLQRIFEQPTAAGLAAALADPRALTTPLIRFDRRREAEDRRPVLVLMPGVLSLPFYLRDLAQAVADELAIVSVQLPGLAEGETPIDTVEAQAEYVLGELRRGGLQPPYLLGGHSFGGLVAIEVARRLREAGERVALLMLGDTVRTRSDFTEFQTDELAYTAMTRGLYALYGRLTKLPYSALDGLPATEKFDRVARHMQQEGLFGALELPLARMAAVFKANFRAIGGYRPGPIAGDLALIRTAGGFPAELLEYESGESLDDPGLGWSELVQGRLEIRTMPGDHLSMLDPAHLPGMARIICELVRAGLARQSGEAATAERAAR